MWYNGNVKEYPKDSLERGCPFLFAGAGMTKVKVDEKGHIHLSVQMAAVQLGISRAGLYQWMRDREVPKGKDGLVDLPLLLSLRKGVYEEKEKETSDSARKLKAEADFKTSKARQEEMIALQMMGELIPQEQVKDELENLFLEIRQKLLTLKESVKSRVYNIDPELAIECSEVTNELVEELLERLATGNDRAGTGEVGTKPKKRYRKRTADVQAARTADGE